MSGRPRKPTEVLKLHGAFDHDPQRLAARANEPVVTDPLGDPPDCLNEAQQARWRDLAELAPWLKRPARVIVEMTARLWQDMRDGKAGPGDLKLFQSNLVQMGMTPSAQSRIVVPPTPKAEPKFGEMTG